MEICNVATGAVRPSIPAHEAVIIRAVYSSDDELIASISHNGTLRVWDLAADSARRCLFVGNHMIVSVAHGGGVWTASDGERLADVADNIYLGQSICFTTAGKWFAPWNGGFDDTDAITIHDITTGDLQRKAPPLDVVDDEAYDEIFSAAVAVPDKRKGRRHASSWRQPEPAIRSVKFMDEHTIAVALREAEIAAWDFRKGQHVKTVSWDGTFDEYPRQMPYRAEVRGDEACVVDTASGQAIAWFHCGRDLVSSLRFIAHPHGRAWAGMLRQRLFFFIVESHSAT